MSRRLMRAGVGGGKLLELGTILRSFVCPFRESEKNRVTESARFRICFQLEHERTRARNDPSTRIVGVGELCAP